METPDRRKSILTCLIVSIVMLPLTSIFVMSRNTDDDARLLASGAWTLFLVAMVFMILRTGRTRPWRSIFFIVYAFSFVFVFISDLIAERGSMALTAEIVQANEAPLCPVALPQLILPAFLRKLLIFPTQIVTGSYGGFWAVFSMWLVGLITLGRGWCSWACFYGGLDEGFAKILRRPVISTRRLPPRLRYLPHAVLALIAVWSFVALEPTYCEWLCPLKLVTEYPAIDDPVAYLQAVIFITLGIGLLFVLPLLTKKRTQCGLFCPLGAMQSLMSPANPYRVRIDPERCSGCRKCVSTCPTFSLLAPAAGAAATSQTGLLTGEEAGTTAIAVSDATASRTPHVSHTCTRCGECMSACDAGAIDYALVGVPTWRPEPGDAERPLWRRLLKLPLRTVREVFEARTLFVVSAVLFGGTISGGFVPRALVGVTGLVFQLFGLEVT